MCRDGHLKVGPSTATDQQGVASKSQPRLGLVRCLACDIRYAAGGVARGSAHLQTRKTCHHERAQIICNQIDTTIFSSNGFLFRISSRP